MRCLSKSLATLAFAIAILGICGCAKKRFNVTGKVSYNDSVISKYEGIIIFVGPNGEQVDAQVGTDGTFQAIGVAEGANKVAVYYANPKLQSEKPSKPKPGEKMKENPPAYLTPAEYASPETSGIKIDVDGDKKVEVRLKGKQPIP